ncbi:MAG: phytoene/squalene synthase family protein [Wenzhouxiangella sp.]|nr:MAG: phytoene/squalene synthase family protein [Wenzhouxiangella sp.]
MSTGNGKQVQAGSAAEPEAVMKAHGRSFHLAARLLPRPVRASASRLYAFCRHVDDLADTSDDPQLARAQLRALREDIAGQTPRSARSRDFLELAAQDKLPIAPALTLIDTVSQEIEGTRVAGQADLVGYAYGVAGTVGLMMCSVLGAREPGARAFAVDLGIAMQLTNIARDVGEDAAMGRVYLPATWTTGLTCAQILRPDPAQRELLRQATARCLALADRYYASGLSGLRFLPTRSRYAIGVAAQVYRAIGDRVADADYRSWDRRAVVPVPARLRIAAASLLREMVSGERAEGRPGARSPRTRHHFVRAATHPDGSPCERQRISIS